MLDRSLWPLLAVMALFISATVVIPTFAPVAISDDWTYARSVEYLVLDGRFHILPIAAATQVFQLFWGAGFALAFGMTFGVLRLSTIVLVGISGLAMFGICRELGVSRQRSALGMALFLFNPVLFPITYSFMSDPQFLALFVISSYWYLRGLRGDDHANGAMILGSAVAALACLQRPHGALIPFAVTLFLVLTGRVQANRSGAVTIARVVAIPAATFLTFYLVISRGLPSQQSVFLDQAKEAGWGETWLLIRRLTIMEMVYIGLFVLPLALAVLGRVRGIAGFRRPVTVASIIAWNTILVTGVVWLWIEGRRMPYIPHFLGRGGPGAGDLRDSRPPLASSLFFDTATIVCAIAAMIFGVALIRMLDRSQRERGAAAGMLLAIGAAQAVGVVPQSFLFRNWIVSLDRYLLPIMPGAIALMLWALNGHGFNTVVAWTAMACVGFVSIVGTRDALVFQDDVWRLASALNRAGVPDTRLDAGYAWDAYHLWEYGQQYDIPRQTPDGTWWTDVYAKPTDSTYVIAGGPIPGYDVLSVQPYSAWLQRRPVALYVLRRTGTPADGVTWGASGG